MNINEDDARRQLSARFTTALGYAAELHARQCRKKARDVAYVSHLMIVSGLVLEDGGSEKEAIAALLHDAMEDQGLAEVRIAEDFGKEVARIVAACSDAAGRPGEEKQPFLPRKKAHLAHLRALGGDEAVLRVTAADKLHNCLDIVADVQDEGVERLDDFNGGRQGTCWYYGQMVDVLEKGLPDSRLTKALRRAAEQLHELAKLHFPAAEPGAEALAAP